MGMNAGVPGPRRGELVEIDLDDGWRCSFTLSGDQPIVTEVRLFAADPAAVPEGGLTYRHIRGINISDALIAHGARNQDTSSRRGYAEIIREEPLRPGRRGHDQRFVAVLCHLYVDAIRRGSAAPINDVTDKLHTLGKPFSKQTVRLLIHRARTQDPPMLTPSITRGRAGGTLTHYARELLADESTKGKA